MPRKGRAFPIDDEWRASVRHRLAELGWDQAEFARKVSCSKATITALMKDSSDEKASHQTSLLPKIHKALGWPDPMPPLASPDMGELAYIFDRLDDVSRARFLERGQAILEEQKRRKK